MDASSPAASSGLQADLPPLPNTGRHPLTLEQFTLDQQAGRPHATGAFTGLIRDLSVAAKVVNHHVRRAGILDVVGTSGVVNVQGEMQKTLDVIADAAFTQALTRGGACCLIGSEEHASPTILRPRTDIQERYAVFFDPLDGSSNTDVNASVGSIFSIFSLPREVSLDAPVAVVLEAALQPGSEQVAAGYVAYGAATLLVYTTGNGVNGFTLDPSLGDFVLTHPDLTLATPPRIYAINEADVV